MANDSGNGPLRFVSTDLPFWGMYESIKPLQIMGHYETFVTKLIEKVNWNYEGIITEDFLDYGKVYGAGNGTGILGYLLRNESDVGLAVITPTINDIKYLDFTNVVLEEDWKILTSAKEVFFDSPVFAISKIFSPLLWLSIGCCLITFSSFWGIIERCFSRLLVGSVQTPIFRTISQKFFFLYCSTLGQGLQFPPQSFGWLRIAVLCWVISAFVLNYGFTGCLLAMLTLPPKPNYIEEIEDLLRIPNTPIFTLKDTPAEFHFRDSSGKIEQSLWRRIQRLGVLISAVEESVNFGAEMEKMYQRQQVTFLPDSAALEFVRMTIDCDSMDKPMHMSKDAAFKIRSSFPLRKNLGSPYAEIFKYVAQRLFETGLILRTMYFENWKGMKCFSNGEVVGHGVEALPMTSFFMAFMLYLVLAAVFLAVFVFELSGTSRRYKSVDVGRYL